VDEEFKIKGRKRKKPGRGKDEREMRPGGNSMRETGRSLSQMLTGLFQLNNRRRALCEERRQKIAFVTAVRTTDELVFHFML